MTRMERYYFLGIFGGGKPIGYFTLIQIGTLHLANPQNRKDIWVGSRSFHKAKTYQQVTERFFKEALRDGLIMRVETEFIRKMRLEKFYLIEPYDWDYQITPKGDECLRIEQIARDGDYSFYKGFDRTMDSAKKINPGLFGQN